MSRPTSPTRNPSTSLTSKNWIDWFESRESSEFVNKQAQEELFQAFNASVDNIDCKKSVLDHQEVLFLFKETFGQRLNVFHHVAQIGGTIYDRAIHFGMIQGVDNDLATSTTPDMDALLDIADGQALAVPTPTSLLQVSSIEDIDALTNGASTVYTPRTFIPITPFLCRVIVESIEQDNGDSKELLIKVVQAIKNFDTEHNTDNEFKDRAKQKCKDLMFWIYLASKDNIINPIPTTVNVSRRVKKYLDDIKAKCIKSAGRNNNNNQFNQNFADALGNHLKRPLEIIATSNSTQSDILRSFQSQHEKSTEKSAKSFTKLPMEYQNMILVASSLGDVTAMELNEKALAFFKCTNNLNANIMLNSLLETAGIDCSISTAMTQALMCGCFLWKNSLTPSGFAASVITSQDNIRNDTLHDGMVLDLSTKFEMTAASLDKLTKMNVRYPSNIEGLIERLRALKTLSCFFFNELSPASQGLTSLALKCMDNKPLLRSRAMVDDEFIAKLICCVDDRLYQWLKECSRAKFTSDTTLLLTNFGDIFQDIQLNRFYYKLPVSVKKISPPSNQDDTCSNKKQKETKRHVNRNQEKEWKIRPSEQWESVFRHRSTDGPELSMGCRPCLKYHCKGACFDDCTNKDSHVNLKDSDKCKTDAFIKQLRGE
jgi:hypothetical protein